MAEIVKRRAVLAAPEEDDGEFSERFCLADMPADPAVAEAWVTIYDFDDEHGNWKADGDRWLEATVQERMLLVVTMHAPTQTICPTSQVAQLYKLVKVAAAHTLLVLEPGMIRVRDAKVHTICPLVLKYSEGNPPVHQNIATELFNIIGFENNQEPTQQTREAASKVAEARRSKSSSGGVFFTPAATPAGTPRKTMVGQPAMNDKTGMKIPALPLKKTNQPPKLPRDSFVDDEIIDPLADSDDDDTARVRERGQRDHTDDPWHVSSTGAALEVDAVYDISWVYAGKARHRRAKAIAVDKIRFEDLDMETSIYPPSETAGITKLVCTLVSEPWRGKTSKTGIQYDDVTTMMPFFDSQEVRQILIDHLRRDWKTTETFTGHGRREAQLAELMSWGARYAAKPNAKDLAAGRKLVAEVVLNLRALKEKIPEDELRCAVEKLSGGLTELDRAVEAVFKERGKGKKPDNGYGGRRQQGERKERPPPPKDRIHGTCDTCKEKGHIAKNCPKNKSSGATPN